MFPYKTRFFSLLLIFISFGLISCSALKKSSSGAKYPDKEKSYFLHNSSGPADQVLANYIRTLPRLEVRGISGNYEVINSARATLTGDKRPLFVVDGVRTGRDFNVVTNIVQLQRVSSIKFLTLNEASFKYGGEGKNGVIEINYIGLNN